MTSQLTSMTAIQQRADQIAAGDRARRADEASPRTRSYRPTRVWH
jgi:hypothetical protein